MPLEPLTPARRRALTREHLLAAAGDVFAARGYHAATIDEIAEAAGFSKGAVYSNFASKEDLFLALLADRERQLIDAFAAAAEPNLDPASLIASLRTVYAGSAPDERQRNWQLWFEFALYSLRNQASRDKLRADQRAGFQLIVELVEKQCRRAGIVPPIAVDLIARIYVALFSGLWQQQVLDPEGVDDDAFAAAVVFIGQAIEALGRPTP
jgi:AcrR family transcriptional regulator